MRTGEIAVIGVDVDEELGTFEIDGDESMEEIEAELREWLDLRPEQDLYVSLSGGQLVVKKL